MCFLMLHGGILTVHGGDLNKQIMRSSRIRVNLLSYESKPTDKREQYDWRTEKNFNGMQKLTGLLSLLLP